MAGVKRRPLTRRIDAAVLTALVIENGDGSDLLTDYFAAGDAVASGPVFGARDPGPSAGCRAGTLLLRTVFNADGAASELECCTRAERDHWHG